VLATLGYFVAELWHPLYDGKIPAGLAAIGQVPAAGWLQIIAAIGIIELTVGKQDYENKGPGELGEFGQAFNPFKDDPEAFAALQVAKFRKLFVLIFLLLVVLRCCVAELCADRSA
jgi:Chlorophyll A-B binding protein